MLILKDLKINVHLTPVPGGVGTWWLLECFKNTIKAQN